MECSRFEETWSSLDDLRVRETAKVRCASSIKISWLTQREVNGIVLVVLVGQECGKMCLMHFARDFRAAVGGESRIFAMSCKVGRGCDL